LTLQKQGVIEYHRGHITVLDRPQLEALSCECYKVAKRETDRLLPYVGTRAVGANKPPISVPKSVEPR